jgi:hypothetical protein
MIHAENERSFDAALRGMAYPLTMFVETGEQIIDGTGPLPKRSRNSQIVLASGTFSDRERPRNRMNDVSVRRTHFRLVERATMGCALPHRP